MTSRPDTALSVRPITAAEHQSYVERQRSVSFLQTPAWGRVKTDWLHESIGWFDGTELVGAGLVLYRQVPKVKRYLAYLPEGPDIDWSDPHLDRWLTPMRDYLKSKGSFGIRMGPPVVTRTWDAATIKAGVADDAIGRLQQLSPTSSNNAGSALLRQLRDAGWQSQQTNEGFAAGQPQYNFQVPLRDEAGEQLSEDQVLKGMNQLWRRNIKKATKMGVEVTSSTSGDGLAAFQDLYVHTAERDGFTPRPASYFRVMQEALNADAADRFTYYFAHHEGDLVAATIGIRVGAHYWYSYGASSTEKRDVRGSNAIQWRMIQDALADHCDVYDLRGITDTLDKADSHVGLIQFKVGTGGEAVEYAGEWDLPVNKLIYKAFTAYMGRR